MKTLVISDTHLSHRFDRKKFYYLRNLFLSVDQIIINGDFWDHHKTTLDKFLSSQWNQLFPILKEKNTVYIFGNHDDKFEQTQVLQFCNKVTNTYNLHVGSHELVITHGQEVIPYLNAIHVFVDKTPILHKPVGLLIDFLVRLPGRVYIKTAYKKMNEDMKQWAQSNLKQNQILVCGHSHLQEVDILHQFIDLGGNTQGLKQYMIVSGSTLLVTDNDRTKRYFL